MTAVKIIDLMYNICMRLLFGRTDVRLSKYNTIIMILSISIISIHISEAFADIPNINTFVAADPDNGDTVYSNGDTFTLTFSLPINATASGTMSQGEINANFTLSGGASFGTTYSGQWSADTLTLVITVTNVAGATTPIIGTTTIAAAGTSDLGHAGDPPTSSTLTGTPTLGGNYGLFVALTGGAGGCRGDCYDTPTSGVDDNGRRIVTGGFSYNGNHVDVEGYYTPYPLITVDVGAKNIAEFKIFDHEGPNDIRHFELAFGLSNGQSISISKASILWDRTFNGIETVTLVDPDNVLDNVSVKTRTGKCNTDPTPECLIVSVEHTFRAPPEFNIVGTNVWDTTRNSWQNYFNDGIAVVGESMNPPKQHTGINKGQLITITETAKNKAIDSDGNTWTFDKEWIMDYVPKGKIIDKISSHGYDRNHALFGIYKQGQELLGKQTLEEFCEKCSDDSFAEMNDIFTYDFPQRIDKTDDPEVQKKIISEISKAEKILAQIFSTSYHAQKH